MSFPRYPKYKDSGVKWLGEVPEHWRLIRLRFLLRDGSDGIKIGPFGSQLTPEALDDEGEYKVYGQENVIASDFSRGRRRINTDKFKELAAYEVVSGDLLITMMGTSGRCDVVPRTAAKGIMDSHLLRMRISHSVSAEYVRLAIDEAAYVGTQIRLAGKGSIMHGLNSSIVKDVLLLAPTASEQTDILRFLDRETKKLDALVAEQQRLMGLLKEKRQAVISHAVTKGLDPHAPMKPSGIDWLGDVPAHWKVTLLKRAFRSVDYGISDALDADGTTAILRMGNIENGRIVMDDLKFTGDVEPRLLLERGDLLYNRTNSLDLIGKVGMFLGAIDTPVSFASYLVRLRTESESVPEYFAYLLNTEGILGLARSTAFVAIGQCNLNPTRYGQIEVAIPPKTEQIAIAAFLGREVAQIDALTAEAQKVIHLLQERRTALISAAVTGQIDVRELAAS